VRNTLGVQIVKLFKKKSKVSPQLKVSLHPNDCDGWEQSNYFTEWAPMANSAP